MDADSAAFASPNDEDVPKFPLSILRGGKVRFYAETEDGRRSASWTVATARRTKDVYVAARGAPRIKISLHESGSFSIGFLSQNDADEFLGVGASRHLDLWKIPAEFSVGFTLAYQIVFPGRELRAFQEMSSRQVVRLMIEPTEALHAYILVTRPTSPPSALNFSTGVHVASMDLGDGNSVELVALRQPWDDAAQQMVDAARGQTPIDGMPATGQGVTIRRAAHGTRGDGSRYAVDMAPDSQPKSENES